MYIVNNNLDGIAGDDPKKIAHPRVVNGAG